MKKVIFISALAIAAAASCTKSDIVDTKFNEQISFQTYAGRDAMTKATAVESADALKNSQGIGVYGFYTGKDSFDPANSVANLWANERVYWGTYLKDNVEVTGWTYATTKYWANDADKYTFLAYAPYGHSTITNVSDDPNNEDVKNPTITYTVPQTPLSDQQDLLYAKEQGTAAAYKTSGVTLHMMHALARLTVTAYAPTDANGFQFDVKKVTISGKFNTKGTFALATAAVAETEDTGWTPIPATATENVEYVIYDDNTASKKADGTFDVLPSTSETAVNYAKVGEQYNNYLMMIPTKFTADNTAILSVTYTTIYEGQESEPVTKELPIVMDFRMGKAYAINLNFSHTATPITFNVSVATWGDEVPVTSTGTGKNNPEDYAAKTEGDE